MLEIVEYRATDRECMRDCLQLLNDRRYKLVDVLKGMSTYTIERLPDTNTVCIRWYEKGKAESLTPRKQAIENRAIRRQIVAATIDNANDLPSYESVELLFTHHGLPAISRQLLYKQISDIIGRNSKRSVTLEK